MKTWLAAALALFLWGTAAAAPRERNGDFERAFQAAVQRLADDQRALAAWCGGERLFAERDRAWELVLELLPEDEEAHEALGHKRDKKGEWVQNPRRKPGKNLAPEKLEECERRRLATFVSFSNRVFEILFRQGDAVTEKQRAAAFEAILRLNPDDEEVRAALGEARSGQAWVLEETLRAKERRAWIKSAVRAALEEAPEAGDVETTSGERALGIAWRHAVATPAVRVVATCERDEAERIARACHAAAELFGELFGADGRMGYGYTVYVLTGESERDALIDAWPELEPQRRELLRSMAGAGLRAERVGPGTHCVARWDPDPAARLDASVRHTLGLFLRWTFGFDLDQAWAHEGIGLYLTRELVGTRLTWYVAGSADVAENDLRARLVAADINWMNEGYQLLKSGKAPPLAEVLARPVNDLSVPDVLVAYVFAAYLIEGWLERMPSLLTPLGEGADAAAVVARVLGMPLEEVEARLVRWLSERR